MAMSPVLRNRLLAMSGAGAIAIAGTMLTDLEGVRYTPYYDVAGVLTVCYGHTGADIIKTKTYSATECQAMLDKDLVPFARSVERSVKVPTTEYQKAALISFSYNVGVTAFERSSLLRQLNAGNYQAACDGLRQWTYAGGKQWKGLMNRRDVEREVCMWGEKPQKADDSFGPLNAGTPGGTPGVF
ncbi:lysozyme [Cedecea neteri]|uniref:lysozyme n=1 Tax=Cedecea neteri TaxID=158822 RepID=UPI002AA6FC33|nr:lysozyme [Cedecea neteri]WPU24984.1 lysozyme [Cedecea neteri]